MSFRTAFDAFISQPAIYRVQTRILGRRKLDAQMKLAIERVTGECGNGIVVDVGGGTAQTRELWPDSWSYISIDPDIRMVEIEDLVQIDRRIGGADDLPLEDKSVDVLLLQNMSHHLDDWTWKRALEESDRVLKRSGRLIFMDAVLSQNRWISRFFWKLDAGHFPRHEENLESDISKLFDIKVIQRFTLVHHVVLITATPK